VALGKELSSGQWKFIGDAAGGDPGNNLGLNEYAEGVLQNSGGNYVVIYTDVVLTSPVSLQQGNLSGGIGGSIVVTGQLTVPVQ
jgi:hypothetical protein